MGHRRPRSFARRYAKLARGYGTAHDVQHRAEYLLLQITDGLYFKGLRGNQVCYILGSIIFNRFKVQQWFLLTTQTLQVLLNVLLLVLLAGYALSSLALGLQASNPTHRGTVSKGPYAWVRHPAYTCKSLAGQSHLNS